MSLSELRGDGFAFAQVQSVLNFSRFIGRLDSQLTPLRFTVVLSNATLNRLRGQFNTLHQI